MNTEARLKMAKRLTEEAMKATSESLISAMNEFRSGDYEQAAYWLGQIHRQNDKARTYIMNLTEK
jgi:hypothetical protein